MAALASLMGVNWIYFKILRIAKNKDLVDNPAARKLQKVPVPVNGGAAVFVRAQVWCVERGIAWARRHYAG